MMDFYLDGQLVDPATNWKDVSSTLRKDKDLNLFLLFQEYDLTFADSGYDYLIDKINGPGFCTQVDVEIQRDCGNEMRTIFRGILFIADCEVNEKTCTIKVKVNDRSFFSKINNNKNIKTAIDAKFTKNKLAIIPSQIYDLELFNVVNNSSVRTVEACRVEEAFRYLIEFMTDNSIGFVSDTFGASGDWNGLSICTGFRLRGGPTNDILNRWIPFSFIQLFREVNKRIPLVLLVEDPFQNPIVRIESIEYLYGQEVNFFAADVDEIETSFDDSKLYAIVKFGSPTDDTNIGAFPELINFFGYRQEEFHLIGECNIDRTLDLTADWVVSSNVMERVISSLDQGYDKNLFLINSIYTDDFNGRTTNDNFLNQSPAVYNYNALLNNASIADRYIDDLSAQIASYYLNSVDGQASAYSSGTLNNNPGTYILDITWQNFLNQESYDFGNYFDTTTFRYNALQTATYTITAQITHIIGSNFQYAGGPAPGCFLNGYIEHYDQSNTIINRYKIINTNYNAGAGLTNQYLIINPQTPNGSFVSTLSGYSVNMIAGDYLKMRINYRVWTTINPVASNRYGRELSINTNASSTFLRVDSSSYVGTTFLNVDPEQFKIKLHKFSYPMTQTSFESILANPIGRIAFAMNGQQYRYGWINELKYNHTAGVANFVLATSKESQNAS